MTPDASERMAVGVYVPGQSTPEPPEWPLTRLSARGGGLCNPSAIGGGWPDNATPHINGTWRIALPPSIAGPNAPERMAVGGLERWSINPGAPRMAPDAPELMAAGVYVPGQSTPEPPEWPRTRLNAWRRVFMHLDNQPQSLQNDP